MANQPSKQAVFKAIMRADSSFVAGIAAIPGEENARFFIRQRGEDADAFIGRVSAWVKAQGAEGVQMASPDIVEEGMEVGELLMRLRVALGAPKDDDSAEFDVSGAKIALSDDAKKQSS